MPAYLTLILCSTIVYCVACLKVYYYPIHLIRSSFPCPLQCRHNDDDSVSNHQPNGCLLNRLFRRRSKKTSKLRVTGLCAGNSPGPVNSPHKGPVTRKMVPFDDVIMVLLLSNPSYQINFSVSNNCQGPRVWVCTSCRCVARGAGSSARQINTLYLYVNGDLNSIHCRNIKWPLRCNRHGAKKGHLGGMDLGIFHSIWYKTAG